MNSRSPHTMSGCPCGWATRGIRPRSRSASADSLQYLHLSLQQVTNLSSHQAKTADGCLHPPQEGAFRHHHPPLPPTVNNCSGSSVSNTSPDRACSSSSVTMALHLSYKCTSAGREGAAFCCQHSQASMPPHLRSPYTPLTQMQLPAIPPSTQCALYSL